VLGLQMPAKAVDEQLDDSRHLVCLSASVVRLLAREREREGDHVRRCWCFSFGGDDVSGGVSVSHGDDGSPPLVLVLLACAASVALLLLSCSGARCALQRWLCLWVECVQAEARLSRHSGGE
jgi:hypothetical protein